MTRTNTRLIHFGARLLQRLARFARNRDGNIGPLMALLIVPMIGAMGMATEASNWYFTNRSLQNAADSAALAAANNADTTNHTSGSNVFTGYKWAATGVAIGYGFIPAGFTGGTADTTVDAVKLTTGCPGGAASCYKATINRTLPIYLTGLTGFRGNSTTASGARGELISAAAIAGPKNVSTPDCILTLATSGDGLHTSGAPKADLTGCTVQTNSDATCNGSDLHADAVVSVGTDNGCGVPPNQYSGGTALPDPYISKAGNIPADTCGGAKVNYPQESGTLPSTNTPNGTTNWSGPVALCGDVKLTGNVTVSSDTVLVIYNGYLDLNGFTLQTATGAGLTVIFAGTNSVGSSPALVPGHVFEGNGTLDIAAPTSGTWKGVALYQAPTLTSNVSFTASGNNPTLLLTGIVYMPHSDVLLKGAINHATNGASCFVWVLNTLDVRGTGSIFQHTQAECAQAGVTQIYSQVTRMALLQ